METLTSGVTAMFNYDKASVCHVEHIDTLGGDLHEFTLSYEDVIPTDFTPYYEKANFEADAYLTDRGRPEFTDRNLFDWELNDTRSLLFVHELRPEWPQLPRIRESGFRAYLLPLTASKQQAIKTLAESNLYIEESIDSEVRWEIARSSVESVYAKARGQPLALPQWRHMIENYLLGLACEVQVRLDYKRAIRQLKRNRLYMSPGESIHITQEERADVFQKVQAGLYRRLGLDWDVDPID